MIGAPGISTNLANKILTLASVQMLVTGYSMFQYLQFVNKSGLALCMRALWMCFKFSLNSLLSVEDTDTPIFFHRADFFLKLRLWGHEPRGWISWSWSFEGGFMLVIYSIVCKFSTKTVLLFDLTTSTALRELASIRSDSVKVHSSEGPTTAIWVL